jgi:ketosteroid isomerase-like protein
MDSTIRSLVDQQQIRDVVYRYCRGIDRCDYDLVRSCYHPDAVDDHGDFRGGIDDFITYISDNLPRFERTMHFIGNVLIELDGDRARAESYLVAYHHLRASSTKAERDFTAGLRYVDDFERREGEWRIAARTYVFEWSRIDPVAPFNWAPAAVSAIGRRDASDVVFAERVVR